MEVELAEMSFDLKAFNKAKLHFTSEHLTRVYTTTNYEMKSYSYL
jgi:hypothetical protein